MEQGATGAVVADDALLGFEAGSGLEIDARSGGGLDEGEIGARSDELDIVEQIELSACGAAAETAAGPGRR